MVGGVYSPPALIMRGLMDPASLPADKAQQGGKNHIVRGAESSGDKLAKISDGSFYGF